MRNLALLAGLVACGLSGSLQARQLAPVFDISANGNPGSDFTDLQLAIDSVPDGAILLLSGGDHGEAQIVGKSLRLIADQQATEFAAVRAEVRDLAADQWVLVRGVGLFDSSPLPTRSKLDVFDSAGAVWIEGAEIGGFVGQFDPQFFGLVADDADQLHIVRSTLLGTSDADVQAGPGLRLSGGSRAAVYESELKGAFAILYGCVDAAPGLWVGPGSTARVSDGRLSGGSCFEFSGSLGATAALVAAQGELSLRNVELVPGVAAPETRVHSTAELNVLEAQKRGIRLHALVGSGVAAMGLAYGAPGDLVWIGIGTGPQLEFSQELFSVFATQTGPFLAGPFSLPATGRLEVSLTAPVVPPGFGLPLVLQSLHAPLSTSGPVASTGTPTAVVVTDESF